MIAETEVTIPCGWCDTPVSVADDHNEYHPEAEGNL